MSAVSQKPSGNGTPLEPANANSRALTSILKPRPILTSISENIDGAQKERADFEAVNVGKLFDVNQVAGVCVGVGSRHKS